MAELNTTIDSELGIRRKDFFTDTLAVADPTVHDAVHSELRRLQNSIELIDANGSVVAAWNGLKSELATRLSCGSSTV